jgi:hypothetical protein
MHQEKWQDMDDAKGLDEIACDPPHTPTPPANQPSVGNNGIIVRPHR